MHRATGPERGTEVGGLCHPAGVGRYQTSRRPGSRSAATIPASSSSRRRWLGVFGVIPPRPFRNGGRCHTGPLLAVPRWRSMSHPPPSNGGRCRIDHHLGESMSHPAHSEGCQCDIQRLPCRATGPGSQRPGQAPRPAHRIPSRSLLIYCDRNLSRLLTVFPVRDWVGVIPQDAQKAPRLTVNTLTRQYVNALTH